MEQRFCDFHSGKFQYVKAMGGFTEANIGKAGQSWRAAVDAGGADINDDHPILK